MEQVMDRVRIRRRRPQVEAQKPQPAQPITDKKLHLRIACIVLRREDQRLEHRHRLVGRPTTLRAVRIGQRRRQRRARCLKIDHPLPRLQRIPHRLEPLQSIR